FRHASTNEKGLDAFVASAESEAAGYTGRRSSATSESSLIRSILSGIRRGDKSSKSDGGLGILQESDLPEHFRPPTDPLQRKPADKPNNLSPPANALDRMKVKRNRRTGQRPS